MGLDWRALDLAEYLEAVEAHNEAHDPNAGKEPAGSADDGAWLAEMIAARLAEEQANGPDEAANVSED